jgi:recombination protein RecR
MSEVLQRLVGELARLPGIGPKTATRMAHHLLRVSADDARRLATAIVEVKEKLFHCSTCFSITDRDPCSFCAGGQRDPKVLCVVEEPWNIQAIERSREHKGLYHVLLGHLSPQRGISPGDLTIDALLRRLDGVEEVILATNPNVDGEATALYLARLLKPKGVKVSRLAFGMPVGGDIEFTDEVTLGRSLAGRREL